MRKNLLCNTSESQILLLIIITNISSGECYKVLNTIFSENGLAMDSYTRRNSASIHII
jgi:hypothetical protein